MLINDQIETVHDFTEIPNRIISLVPSQTELLYDLGLNEKMVGITKFCVHPKQLLSTKKIVGGTKKVNFEKIRALQPDIIICNKEENTLEMVEQLSKICKVWVTNIITIEDNFRMISDFGEIFDCKEMAQILNNKLNFALSDFKNFIANKPSYTVSYFIWKNPYMVAGSSNFINELLKLNKFCNIYDLGERYPEIDLKNLQSDGNPDLVLLSSEPFPFKEQDAIEIATFSKSSKIIFVNGEMFSWYGSRLLQAFEYFKLLHKNL